MRAEMEIARYTLQMDLDQDEMEIWEARKIQKVAQQYPEAQGFYFEDRRSWQVAILADIREWF